MFQGCISVYEEDGVVQSGILNCAGRSRELGVNTRYEHVLNVFLDECVDFLSWIRVS